MHSSVGVKELGGIVESLNKFYVCRLPLFEHNMRKCYRESVMWWPNWIDRDGKFPMHKKKRVRREKKKTRVNKFAVIWIEEKKNSEAQ